MKTSAGRGRNLLARAAQGLGVALVVSLSLAFCPLAVAEETTSCGNVLVVRGIFTVFSLGLDDLAKQLKERKLEVQVVPAAVSHAAAEKICQKYTEEQAEGPIVLIGHSLGGDLLPALARRFDRHKVPIDLMIMIDSTNPSKPPANVKRCVNLYQSNFSPPWFRVFRGASIEAEDSQTEMVNVDIRELPHQGEADRIDHFNIDSSPWIHEMVFREIGATIPATVRRHSADAPVTANDRAVTTAGATARPVATPLPAAGRAGFWNADPARNANGSPTSSPTTLPILPLPQVFPYSEARPR